MLIVKRISRKFLFHPKS